MDLITQIIRTVTRATSRLYGNKIALRRDNHPLLIRLSDITEQGITDGEVFLKKFIISIEGYKLHRSPRLNFRNDINNIGDELIAHLTALNSVYTSMKSLPYLNIELEENKASITELETMMVTSSVHHDLTATLENIISSYPSS